MNKRKIAEDGRAVEKPVKKKAAKKGDEEHAMMLKQELLIMINELLTDFRHL